MVSYPGLWTSEKPFVISYIDVYSAANNIYRDTNSDLEVVLFVNETSTDAERCGMLFGNIQDSNRMHCSIGMLGRYEDSEATKRELAGDDVL